MSSEVSHIKVGDYVGIKGTWDDDSGLEEIGLVVEVEGSSETEMLEVYGSRLATDWFGSPFHCAKVLLPTGEIEPWDTGNLEIIFNVEDCRT